MITESDLQYILEVMIAIGCELSQTLNSNDETEKLLFGIEEFREHIGGELTITLISGIGKKHDVHTIDMTLMRQAIAKLNKYATVNQ